MENLRDEVLEEAEEAEELEEHVDGQLADMLVATKVEALVADMEE